MEENFLIKGLLIGLIFGVPAGAIGALTIQRSMKHGFLAGLVTGVGSSVADVLYACVGVFGITVISEFLTANQRIIRLTGGMLILALALSILFTKKKQQQADTSKSKIFGYFFTSFSVALFNPATVLSFIIAFTSFGIFGKLGIYEGAMLVVGIFVSTFLWWATLSAVVSAFRKKIKEKIYQWLNYLLAGLLIVFGVVVIYQGIFQ